MSASKQSVCKLGSSCQYKKEGKCLYSHAEGTVSKPAISASSLISRTPLFHKGLIGRGRTGKREIHGAQKGKFVTSTHPLLKAVCANRKARTDLFAKYKQDMTTYFDVKSDKDVKLPSANSLLDRELKLLDDELAAMKSVMRKGMSKVSTRMFYAISTTPAANTAYAVALGICADNSSEFAGYAGLYDEFRVIGGNIKFKVQNSQGSPNATAQFCAAGFDSTYATTPSSVTDVLESQQSEMYGIDPNIANNFISPQRVTEKGYYHFGFKIPFESALSGTTVTGGSGVVSNFPGEWIGAGSVAGTSSGYLRIYVPTPGSSNTLVFNGIVELQVEWRERT